MPDSDRQELIKSNMKRIVALEPQIQKLISMIDLGVSNVYDRIQTIDICMTLSNTLEQLDSDITALMNLLEDFE